jgi:hypothetical protein
MSYARYRPEKIRLPGEYLKTFLIDTGKKEHPSNPRYVRNKRQYRVESCRVTMSTQPLS